MRTDDAWIVGKEEEKGNPDPAGNKIRRVGAGFIYISSPHYVQNLLEFLQAFTTALDAAENSQCYAKYM